MKIGILQTGHAPDTLQGAYGDYDLVYQRLLGGHGFEFAAFAVLDNQFPEGAEDADGWIITGSRHGAYENHDWIAPLEDLIRDIVVQERPLIGVCFGHQIIAQALGGKVEKFDGGWAVGATEYRVGDETVTLNAWHQDQVTRLPENACVLGGNEFCKYAFLGYGDTVWTLQPHPEYDAGFIDGLITTRGRGAVPDNLLDAALNQLAVPNDNDEIAEKMAAFFKRKSS